MLYLTERRAPVDLSELIHARSAGRFYRQIRKYSDNHCIATISPEKNKNRILLRKSVGMERPNAMYTDQENSVQSLGQ